MADAAEGKFDVVLVYHTSRFARNQIESRRYKQLLRERLGIRVISVTQPMGEDPTDPSAFLAESIHEMFDEYYSVSLSFWTRSGLREKARQGHLVGSLPWGYIRDPDTKLATPDPERAPLVLEMFERYATGQESDRTLAAWLNAKGARTARDRPFGKDTVREMLCNAAYAGYVTGLRDKSRSIHGLHEPIVREELFDRVQEVRAWRTRVLKPGPPSEEYLLRKLLYCERCGARMHGTSGSKPRVRRYMCSTRRYGHSCGEPIIKALDLEAQLVDWIRDFQPDGQLLDLLLETLRAEPTRTPSSRPSVAASCSASYSACVTSTSSATSPKRSTSCAAKRSRKNSSASAHPPSPPSTAPARSSTTSRSFWELETEPAERRKLLLSLFAQVWAQDGRIVAVQPHDAFLPYFDAAEETLQHRCEKIGAEGGSDGGRTRDCCLGDRDSGVGRRACDRWRPVVRLAQAVRCDSHARISRLMNNLAMGRERHPEHAPLDPAPHAPTAQCSPPRRARRATPHRSPRRCAAWRRAVL